MANLHVRALLCPACCEASGRPFIPFEGVTVCDVCGRTSECTEFGLDAARDAFKVYFERLSWAITRASAPVKAQRPLARIA